MDAKKALELARVAYPNNEKLRVAYMLGLNKGYEVYEQQMLKDAVEAEVLYFGETQDVSRTIKIPRMQEWLKSLRPSWKPSENQMSMLLAVVNDPNNAGSASCHLSLKSLYKDLKKL